MRVSILGGSEIDIASPQEIQDIVERGGKNIVESLTPRGVRVARKSVTASGVFGASAPLILNCQGPPAGAMWTITNAVVIGDDGHTAVANATAELYAGGEGDNPGIPQIVQVGAAVPVAWNFSRDTIFLHYGDDLAVAIYGTPAAGQRFTFIARVNEWYPHSEKEARYI